MFSFSFSGTAGIEQLIVNAAYAIHLIDHIIFFYFVRCLVIIKRESLACDRLPLQHAKSRSLKSVAQKSMYRGSCYSVLTNATVVNSVSGV